MADARRQPQQHRRVELLAQLKRGDRQVFRLLAVAGLQAGNTGELGEGAVVLLVLAGVHRGVVGGDDHQARLDAGHRRVHEGVGRDVQADVLHGRQGALARVGRADRHVHGDLFVGRPFGVDVGETREFFEDFGGGGAGVRGGDGDAGLPRPARDGFVAGEHTNHDLSSVGKLVEW